jgi:hypothetical protein
LPALSVSKLGADRLLQVGGKGLRLDQPRISAPAAASARTSSVSSVARRCWMRSARPSCLRNSRKAWAVVAKPVGTRTPVGQLRDHFAEAGVLAADRLDVGHSQVLQTVRPGRSRQSADMGKLQKLKPGNLRAAHARQALGLWVVLMAAAAWDGGGNSELYGRIVGVALPIATFQDSPS